MLYKFRGIIIVLGLFLLLPFLYVGITAITAYYDWENNKERLIQNLKEYYNKIKDYQQKDNYIILDDEGKMIEIEPTRIFDCHHKIIGEFSPSKREIVTLDQIPENLINSLVFIEDHSFYEHHGMSIKGMARALIKNIVSLRVVEGGSSITQQLAKILFTSRQRNIYRKFLELYGALYIEKQFTKKDILLMYLNTVYFGHGTYGLQSASHLYFNKNLRNLNQLEMALLISLIPAPNYISPFNNISVAKKKHKIVLERLKEKNLITHLHFEQRYMAFWQEFEKRLEMPSISYWKMNINQAPYVTEEIRRYLSKRFSVSQILQGNLKIYTTIDLDIQNILQNESYDYYKSLKNVFTNTTDYKQMEMAGVIFNPENGDLLGLIGGKGYTFKNQFNRAFQMKRQIGSVIKPFIYTAGIDEKLYTLTTIMTDQEIVYKDKNRNYIPKNFDFKYRGPVLFREGLFQSINSISVQILNRFKPEYFLTQYLKPIYKDIDVDIQFLPVLSLGLGTVEMNPFELGLAYCILANQGNKVYPSFINQIQLPTGDMVIDNTLIKDSVLSNWSQNNEDRIFSKGACYIISDTLKYVFSQEGTGAYAASHYVLPFRISGKTGTTSYFKDAWCVGYTKDYVVVLWLGFDDYGKSENKFMTGGKLTAPLIIKIFNKLYWNKSYSEIPIPSDELTFCNINKSTGKLAQSSNSNVIYNVPYLNGTQPREY